MCKPTAHDAMEHEQGADWRQPWMQWRHWQHHSGDGHHGSMSADPFAVAAGSHRSAGRRMRTAERSCCCRVSRATFTAGGRGGRYSTARRPTSDDQKRPTTESAPPPPPPPSAPEAAAGAAALCSGVAGGCVAGVRADAAKGRMPLPPAAAVPFHPACGCSAGLAAAAAGVTACWPARASCCCLLRLSRCACYMKCHSYITATYDVYVMQ